jgi:predicted Zn-dependent protease
MAIAAGLPVPQVYLIDDAAINAFAAGYQPQDAVIGVTRGCVHELSRDELQGVIAHEFSHILNGDMRLNIRLIGWLYGIMVVGLIGYHLLRSMRYTGGGRNRKNGGGVVFLALGLMIVGYGGTFFGNLIKAAVSRQREFLADASAVQYTRNPDGISGALKKIGGYAGGTAITVTDTTEISHMLFGQGSRSAFFATHPPLEERIRRIEPRWAELPADATPEPNASMATSDSPRVQGFADSVGRPTAASLTEAQQRLDMLPADLREEVHNTLGACLTIFALVIAASEPQSRAAQWQYLRAQLARPSQDRLTQLDAAVMTLDRKLHLPLIELAQPVLRQLSRAQQATFMEQLQQLIKTDAKITLFEWSLVRILGATLARPGDRAQKELLELEQCKDECVVLLAVLARTGRNTEDGASAAFSAGLSELQLKTPAHLLAMDAADLAALDKAMDRLRKLKPLQKPRLLKALMRCVRSDGIVTSSEAELLRAIGAVLDCPIPPLA